MDKRLGKSVAVIDIGSSIVRMRISQWDGQKIRLLDELERPVQLGQEVFATGYISFETVRRLSEILTGFCTVAQEYDVGRIHATATTALREAVNQAYVLDHLAIQNHLNVQVLEDNEANALLFDVMKDKCTPEVERVLMVYAGTGTIDFALMEYGQVIFTHSMHTGLIKIAEMLRETSEYTRHIDRVAKELMNTYLIRSNRIVDLLKVDSIVFSLGDMSSFYRLCGLKENRRSATVQIKREVLDKVYEEFRLLSIDQVSSRQKVSPLQGGTLYAALILMTSVLGRTKLKTVYCVDTSLADAILSLQLKPGARRAFTEGQRAGTIASALDLGRRYHCDISHAKHVMGLAMILYKKLRKIHGLSRRQSLLLQTACILHESGQYTNTKDMQEASFDLVKDAQIYGLRSRETFLAANIIAPQTLLGVKRDNSRDSLQEDEVLFVAKMHALLLLADALDYSRKQKAELYDVGQDGSQLILKLQVHEEYTLERWMFRQSAPLFQDVFGLVPQLEIENVHPLRRDS